MNPAGAGALYAGLVFACGFVFGTFRVLVLAPALGAVPAVLIELPVMLGLSFWIAGRIVARARVGDTIKARAAMGTVAFVVLMVLEVALGVFGFGQGMASIGAGMLRPEGLIGLAGQVAFAAMPVFLPARPPNGA